ncbi:hypothetical protein PUN71_022575 [Arthrobacter sp. NQ7]|uniref:hypothetical protein n=1 Tax=Arthrobacter sp. NQ7 TaxID=3032303 RepID=UPI0024107FE7|nr:hypothetical protein [Arthrobacter sp. NQ7]MDJ0459998.1 hypothetical protein [Arthrobacter sp. NQ7]
MKKVIEDHSVAAQFHDAVHEWAVVAVEEHPDNEGECVCGQQNLLYMYTIYNSKKQETLSYIGSQCVHHFKRQDLDMQVSVFSQLLALKRAIEDRKKITLTSDYFSRALLEWLFAEGAFNNARNGYNGEEDYAFFLKMFNKRKKEDISAAQNRKIWVMLNSQVYPYIRDHPALG